MKMPNTVHVGEIYTQEEIEKLGLVYIHENYADLLIYKRNDERYLLERAGENTFKIYLKY